MEIKDKAIELVYGFIPYVYCFMGSGMLTNTYDRDIAFWNAKKCASFAVKNIIGQWEIVDAYVADGNGELNPNLKYWYQVEQAIELLTIEEYDNSDATND